jgi:murein DD-endopeptidase MepM/ murein hydrolase activator NlpD
MSKFYYYDADACEFKHIQYTTTEKLVHATSQWLLFGVVIAGLLVIGLSMVAGSPAEMALKAENKVLLQQLRMNRQTLEELDTKINVLAETDNEIYRQVLGLDPISYDQRMAGVGGTAMYEEFDVFKSETADILKWTNMTLDNLQRRVDLQLESFKEVQAYYNENQEKMRQIPAIRPIGTLISSGFGMRMHPVLNYRRMHEGIDFRASIGTEIYATGDGVIKQAGIESSFGRMIRIDHGFGYATIYAHLSRFAPNMRVGRKVKRGELIGYSGDSGLVEAPHLHYEVHKDGRAVNPIFYLFADITPEEYLTFRRISEENENSLD